MRLNTEPQRSLVCKLNDVMHYSLNEQGYYIRAELNSPGWGDGYICGSISGECWASRSTVTVCIYANGIRHTYSVAARVTTERGFKTVVGRLILHHIRRQEAELEASK